MLPMSESDYRISLHGLSYDETVAASPPIKVTSTSTPSPQRVPPHGSNLAMVYDNVTLDSSPMPNGASQSYGNRREENGVRSISATQAPSAPAQESQTESNSDNHITPILKSPPSIPQIRVDPESELTTPKVGDSSKKWLSMRPTKSRTNSQKKDTNTLQSFQGIALDIPNGSWGDELQSKNLSFSNRGSMLINGRKVSPTESVPAGASLRPTMGTKRVATSSSVPDRMPLRIMSTDDEMLSEKVRYNYAHGADTNEVENQTDMANKMGSRWQNQLGTDAESVLTTSRAASTTDLAPPRSPSISPSKGDTIPREELELAGGLEDWQDIDNADVDRYGFIVPRSPTQKADASGVKRSPTVSGQGLQRVSTSLQLASEASRPKRLIGRSSVDGQHRVTADTLTRTISNQSTARPSSSKSATMHRYTTLRAASNRLPGNKDRRLMDEASDMFTLPHSLTAGPLTRTETAESDRSSRSKANLETKASSTTARRKETEREEKWRKMAKPMPSNAKDPTHRGIGGGMLFSFPPLTDSKLISRAWKGIPDTWRAPAWHYFLSVSARKDPRSLPDDKLVNLFYEYQDTNSPDDVQIDIDVPRTISSHIMFRRRYRGGQRLLFRVLHAMSLHWPETGYVQGMAALAATLLSYYEEEKAFVMLVRLWECRGLGKLYKEGFGGLMEALDDFERGWLGNGEVAKKLNDLNIFPTAYGTKWYLTLFNYSVPFPAQLRVWDVFILLGDNHDAIPTTPRPTAHSNTNNTPAEPNMTQQPEEKPFGTTLDVLHAASAALIDGMRDILLDSDFENAMKVLTSWIPIRDEDLFMRVARAEWKMHRERSRKKGIVK